MLGFTSFLCVILLVRANHKDHKDHRQEILEAARGKNGDYGLRSLLMGIPAIVADLAVGITEDAGGMAQSDFKELHKELKEKKVKVTKVPEESEEDKSDRKLRKAALQLTVRDAMKQANMKIFTYALEAAKHCRGEDDVVLGKLLGEESVEKRAIKEDGCLANNPRTEEIKGALEDLENVMFNELQVIVDKTVEKLYNLLGDVTNFDFDAEEMFVAADVRKVTAERTQNALERIDKLLEMIVEAAKRVDSAKNRDKKIQRLQESFADKKENPLNRGVKKVTRELKKVVKDGDASYNEIEKTVSM